jgi:predicted DNA-binding antitoxin AbrB/MazE fold protein
MTITVEATYANGVLRPNQPLPLAENEKVQVTVVPTPRPVPESSAEERKSSGQSLAEQLIALANSIPEEVVAKWPTDGASQHDHYIYGTPKRKDLRE